MMKRRRVVYGHDRIATTDGRYYITSRIIPDDIVGHLTRWIERTQQGTMQWYRFENFPDSRAYMSVIQMPFGFMGGDPHLYRDKHEIYMSYGLDYSITVRLPIKPRSIKIRRFRLIEALWNAVEAKGCVYDRKEV